MVGAVLDFSFLSWKQQRAMGIYIKAPSWKDTQSLEDKEIALLKAKQKRAKRLKNKINKT